MLSALSTQATRLCPVRIGSCSYSTRVTRVRNAAASSTRRTPSELFSSPLTTLSDVPPLSTVEKGTAYEEHTQAFLRETFPRMDLMRIGGANDGGVDLTGWWWSPLQGVGDQARALDRVRVTVQCKSEARKLGPVHVREMQGVMTARHDVAADKPSNVLPASMAVLASSSGFSKQCVALALSAPFPLLLLHLLYPSQQRFVGLHGTQFACPTIAANDALLRGLLQNQLEIRWLTTLATPAASAPPLRGRPRAPFKVDLPALFLGGERL